MFGSGHHQLNDWTALENVYEHTMRDGENAVLLERELRQAIGMNELGVVLQLQKRLRLDTYGTMKKLGLEETGCAPLDRREVDVCRAILEGRRPVNREFLDAFVSTGKLPGLVACGTPAEVGRFLDVLLHTLCGGIDRLGVADLEALACPLRDAVSPLDCAAVQLVVFNSTQLNRSANAALLVNALARGRTEADRALIMESVQTFCGESPRSSDEERDDAHDGGDGDDDNVFGAGEFVSVTHELDLGWQCVKCHLYKPRSLFSRNQRKHPKGERQCLKCTEIVPPVYPCSNCRRILQRDAYSQNQWRKGSARRCRSCCEGHFCASFLSPSGCSGPACPFVHSLQPEVIGEIGGVFASEGDGLG